MSGWQEFSGLNRGYVLELYERYRHDPSSVDPETRALFETWTPPADDQERLRTPGCRFRKSSAP
jgi:2-oxoglutarate dehydrogenase E1 component